MSPHTHHQKIVSLELPNSGRGFGFSVVSNGSGGTVIHSIVKGSIAEKVRRGVVKGCGFGLV